MGRFGAGSIYELGGQVDYEGRTCDYREAVRMRETTSTS